MTYDLLMYAHLFAVLPCIIIGAYLLLAKKGGVVHRKMGILYMGLMFFTALVALFLPAKVGPQFLGHFGFIHLLCFLVMYTVPTAFIAAKRGQIKTHQRKMVILYVSAILVAGGFTLMPGRFLGELFFG